ncbi:hypothetical protein AAZX31_09G242700 [Glycine max]
MAATPPRKRKNPQLPLQTAVQLFIFNTTTRPSFVFVFPQSPKTNGRIQDLILSLQEATFMAKHLLPSSSTNNNPYYLLRPPTTTLTPPISTKSTPSSATDGDPMQVEIDADDEETTSKCTIDKVEEKMRHCFIKNKRPKRPLLPSAQWWRRRSGLFPMMALWGGSVTVTMIHML